jgi:hypothetical protein
MKSWPKDGKIIYQYEKIGFWQYENYCSVYHTIYLDRSCLISSIFNINSEIQTEAVQQSRVDEIFNLAFAWYKPLVEN